MIYNALHHRWIRVIGAMFGELIAAASVNLFIVPLGLYSGGLMGACQVVRTIMQTRLGMNFGSTDIAGMLYFALNVPILLLAYRVLGRKLVFMTLVCTASYSLFYSVIPIPAVPIVDDYLTACLLGGILTGIGSGIALTCGGSGGGLDIMGLWLSKRGSNFTVGRFSITFNAFLYGLCLLLFIPEVAIYSVIYNFFNAIVLDRLHQQNITVQALIFTRGDEEALAHFVMEKLGRGVTFWNGVGAYTGASVHVLCVCLSKYEIEELLHTVRSMDPHAFVTVQEGVRVHGNFSKRVG